MNHIVLHFDEFNLYVYDSLPSGGAIMNDALHSWDFGNSVDNDVTSYLGPGSWNQPNYSTMLDRTFVETDLRSPRNLFADQGLYHGPETSTRDPQTETLEGSPTAEMVAVISVHFAPYFRTVRPKRSRGQKVLTSCVKCWLRRKQV